jgi:hypothetical protein
MNTNRQTTTNDDAAQITEEIHDPELAKAVESFMAAGRNAPPQPPLDKPTKAAIIQLPLWPEPVRGAPNTLLRSAFFAAIHSKKRRELGIKTRPEKPLQAVIIAAQNGDTIKYAGTQLNQYDADVFFEALHRARLHPLETECFFRGYDFLKSIRRQDGPREYEDLEDSLTRLRDGRVEIHWKIKDHPLKFVGGLISTYTRDAKTKLFKVTFAKEIRALFAPACWTQLEWQERMTLKGKPLAQWLHSFYSSHVAPFPLSTAYLHDKTGSPRTVVRNFRGDLKHALATLETVLGWKATWDGDLLTIDRPLSTSQARHLRRTKPRNKSLRKPYRRTMTRVSDLLPDLPKPLESGD